MPAVCLGRLWSLLFPPFARRSRWLQARWNFSTHALDVALIVIRLIAPMRCARSWGTASHTIFVESAPIYLRSFNVPDTGGDPYITRMDGQVVEFKGKDGQTYDWYSRGRLRVIPRLKTVPVPSSSPASEDDDPVKLVQCWGGVDVLAGDCKIVAGYEPGKIHIQYGGHHVILTVKDCALDAPGHKGNTSDAPHNLQGVPHCNLEITVYPPGEGATGLARYWSEGGDPALFEAFPGN